MYLSASTTRFPQARAVITSVVEMPLRRNTSWAALLRKPYCFRRTHVFKSEMGCARPGGSMLRPVHLCTGHCARLPWPSILAGKGCGPGHCLPICWISPWPLQRWASLEREQTSGLVVFSQGQVGGQAEPSAHLFAGIAQGCNLRISGAIW